jgi:hypothetical protein
MHGWTLDHVRDLDEDEYRVLVAWLVKQTDQAKHGDSIDVDEIHAAEQAKQLKRAMDGR